MAYHPPHAGPGAPARPPSPTASARPSLYGQPPQQQQQQQQPYGAPPQQQYGPPPQQQQYGSPSYPPPPAHNHYGAGPPAPPPPHGQYHPPHQQPYGHPPPEPQQQPFYPPPQQPPYGAPQSHGQQLVFLGAPVSPLEGMHMGPPPPPPPGYNASFDADRVRKATKGFGTDERTLIDVLAPLGPLELAALARAFEAQVGRALVAVLEKETRGWFEYALRGLAMGPLAWDCWLLHRACAGIGTHEDLLNELLLGRTNTEIYLLKTAYSALYKKDLLSVVKGELSFKTERMFVMALAGHRDESPAPVDPQAVQHDLYAIDSAARGFGTDEIAILGVLLTRSPAHLAQLAQAYQAAHRRPLGALARAEFSGHMRDALLFIARGAEADGRGVERDAEMLEEAMAGLGTKDERLTWRIVRGHWDRPRWEAVKAAYYRRFGRSLKSRVKGETSGDYERVLCALIGA